MKAGQKRRIMRDISLSVREEISAIERLNYERLLTKARTLEELVRIERKVSVNPNLLRSDRDRLLSAMVTTSTTVARSSPGEEESGRSTSGRTG